MVVQDRWRSEIVEGTVKAVESGKQSKQRLYYTEWNDGEAEHLDGVMVDLMRKEEAGNPDLQEARVEAKRMRSEDEEDSNPAPKKKKPFETGGLLYGDEGYPSLRFESGEGYAPERIPLCELPEKEREQAEARLAPRVRKGLKQLRKEAEARAANFRSWEADYLRKYGSLPQEDCRSFLETD